MKSLDELIAGSNQEWLRNRIEEAIEAYLDDLDDPGDVDSDDLADNVARHLLKGEER